MSPYTALLRDLARRRLELHPLTRAEIAIIVDEHSDVVGEALCDSPALFSECLRDNAPMTLSALVVTLLRKQCMAYIARDVDLMRDQMEEEDRADAEYERGCTA
jgi:hypothetical protein